MVVAMNFGCLLFEEDNEVVMNSKIVNLSLKSNLNAVLGLLNLYFK